MTVQRTIPDGDGAHRADEPEDTTEDAFSDVRPIGSLSGQPQGSTRA